MADCVSWLSTVAQDRAWLAETAALEWNEDDDATEGEEDEDEQGDEAVVVAAAVCAYELEGAWPGAIHHLILNVGETWADLGGGEWTTLYLVEERRRCSLSLRVAALDQTSQDGQQELAVASAMMADGALVLDDVDDPTFGELSCGTVDGDEIAVYGLRFATVDAALSFQASLKDACLRMHAGERPSENDSTSDASAHAIATVQPSPTPSLRVILPTPVPVLAPAAHSPAPASPATPAPAPPSPPRRAAVSDDAAAVAEETAAHLEASASMRLELQAMGFEGSQIDASLSALQAASAEAHVDWILEHASAIVAPVDEFDAEASPLFSFESAENTAWSLVEEAANATLTACAFDASSPNDSDRAQRAARSAAACARALLDGDELSTASKTFRDAWWRGVAQRATVVPQGEARPELRQAAQAIGRHIRSEVYARCTGAADDGADYAKGAGEEKSTEPADAARLLDEPVPPRGTGTRPTSGGSTSSTASNHNARLRDLAAAAARATSEVARRQAAKSPRKRGPLIGAFLRMTRSTSARTPARRIATPHYAPPPAPGPPPEPRDVVERRPIGATLSLIAASAAFARMPTDPHGVRRRCGRPRSLCCRRRPRGRATPRGSNRQTRDGTDRVVTGALGLPTVRLRKTPPRARAHRRWASSASDAPALATVRTSSGGQVATLLSPVLSTARPPARRRSDHIQPLAPTHRALAPGF